MTAAFADTDTALQARIVDQAIGAGVEIDAIGFGADRHRSGLLLALAAVHLVEVGTSLQTPDRHFAHVTHLKIRMQRITDGNRAAVSIARHEIYFECRAHGYVAFEQ